ncbi:hypothetical protein [Paraburkholderia hospita]|uniref:Uncharacterized protein n=1 Tax=Paraburkholderia hospita TaxID=169430 RepID=A0AAN1JIE0_9BURK|nr:hypothetical protein [Paraburkholderia hospita]AUT74295.1 hypothetical protein C2L64_39210 [Paraburkholderia hospita]EIN01275.1 hypothetical protein WQE_10204 [Paraburkholderia hospita]OUL84583.1 hypothetical protein CA601_25810 [Paraburkholderia hospita]OUL86910.1 hypothetical protein CA602_14870 [Paraburkholderia hospita]SEH58039.1 hypothetical protein SAMN05192544_10044 [Paraburkholderia hospita]
MTENAETLFVASEDIATALNLLESVEIEIGFDSDDPESVEQAILAVEEAINARLSGHRGDARIESAILRVKLDFRCAILDQASSDEDDDGPISSVHTVH